MERSVAVDRTVTVTTSGMDDGNLVFYTIKNPSNEIIFSVSSEIIDNSTNVTINPSPSTFIGLL